jgi:RNA polymerase sigma-70 factor, ECF subfamily
MHSQFFEQMAMPLFDQLYNSAHWLTGNRSDAEDLVQETYVKALRGFSSFQEGTNLRAWMFRILRNTFLTSRSGLVARNTQSLEDECAEDERIIADVATPESILIRKEDEATILSALAHLPLPYREVILLCEIEEMSYREIAEVLSVPIGTVMSRLSRARGLLSQAIRAESERGSRNAV